jgi:hypothetical protein
MLLVGSVFWVTQDQEESDFPRKAAMILHLFYRNHEKNFVEEIRAHLSPKIQQIPSSYKI